MVKLSKLNPDNVKIKGKYKQFLKHQRLEKLTDETINSKLSKISRYEEINRYENFKSLDINKGIKFYDYLENEFEGKRINISTLLSYLLAVKEFYIWFAENYPKYKRKILAVISVFEPREEHKRLANAVKLREFPTKEEFEKIISFDAVSISDKRDKVFIIFLLISCARINAVATSKIAAVNLSSMLYIQDSEDGVLTKRNKYIVSQLFKFKQEYFDMLGDWVGELRKIYHFNDESLLFPSIQNNIPNPNVGLKEADYNRILKNRCQSAGVKTYTAHEFRHLGISSALSYVRTGLQLKALSQSVGHELIMTILQQYANMTPEVYLDILANLIPDDKGMSLKLSEYSTSDLLKELQRRDKSMPVF